MTKKLSKALKEDKDEILNKDNLTLSTDLEINIQENFAKDNLTLPFRDKINSCAIETVIDIENYLNQEGLHMCEYLTYENIQAYIEYIVYYNLNPVVS